MRRLDCLLFKNLSHYTFRLATVCVRPMAQRRAVTDDTRCDFFPPFATSAIVCLSVSGHRSFFANLETPPTQKYSQRFFLALHFLAGILFADSPGQIRWCRFTGIKSAYSLFCLLLRRLSRVGSGSSTLSQSLFQLLYASSQTLFFIQSSLSAPRAQARSAKKF